MFKTIVRTAVITDTHKVLLLKRSADDERGALEWDLPGGTAEPGMDLPAEACRELKEESGIHLHTDQLRLVHSREYNHGRGPRRVLCFLARVASEPEITLSEEHEAFEWSPLNQAENRQLFQNQEDALRYISQGGLVREA